MYIEYTYLYIFKVYEESKVNTFWLFIITRTPPTQEFDVSLLCDSMISAMGQISLEPDEQNTIWWAPFLLSLLSWLAFSCLLSSFGHILIFFISYLYCDRKEKPVHNTWCGAAPIWVSWDNQCFGLVRYSMLNAILKALLGSSAYFWLTLS